MTTSHQKSLKMLSSQLPLKGKADKMSAETDSWHPFRGGGPLAVVGV